MTLRQDIQNFLARFKRQAKEYRDKLLALNEQEKRLISDFHAAEDQQKTQEMRAKIQDL